MNLTVTTKGFVQHFTNYIYKLFELKQRHQRTMEYWQREKEKTKINKIIEMFKYLNIY